LQGNFNTKNSLIYDIVLKAVRGAGKVLRGFEKFFRETLKSLRGVAEAFLILLPLRRCDSNRCGQRQKETGGSSAKHKKKLNGEFPMKKNANYITLPVLLVRVYGLINGDRRA
jgi:hypothetical protein